MKDEILDVIKDSIIVFLLCARECKINLDDKDEQEIEELVNAFMILTFEFSMKTSQKVESNESK